MAARTSGILVTSMTAINKMSRIGAVIITVVLMLVALTGCTKNSATAYSGDKAISLTSKEANQFVTSFKDMELMPFSYWDTAEHTANWSGQQFDFECDGSAHHLQVLPLSGILYYDGQYYTADAYSSFFDVIRQIEARYDLMILNDMLADTDEFRKDEFASSFGTAEISDEYNYSYNTYCAASNAKVADIMTAMGLSDETDMTLGQLFSQLAGNAPQMNDEVSYNGIKFKIIFVNFPENETVFLIKPND